LSEENTCWYCGERILNPNEIFNYVVSGEVQHWHKKCAEEQGVINEKINHSTMNRKVYYIAGFIVIVLLLTLFITIKNGIENKDRINQANYQKAIVYIQESKWEDAIGILGGLINQNYLDSIKLYNEAQKQLENNKQYQKGVSLIKDKKWFDAGVALVLLKDKNYSNSEVLYNYAAANEQVGKNDLIVASYFLERIPDAYSGEFAEDILKLKGQITPEKVAELKAEKDALAIANKKSEGVRIGMTKNQVLESSWGRPNHVNTTTGSYGVHEQWVYNGYNYLYFEDGILTTIQN
jgi:hypothetical protein